MSRASIARAAAALALTVAVVALALTQAGFPVVAGAIGVRVGSPGAGVEFTRAVLSIVVASLLGVLFVRFGIRALRFGTTARGDLAAGGKLLAATGCRSAASHGGRARARVDAAVWPYLEALVMTLTRRQWLAGASSLAGGVALGGVAHGVQALRRDRPRRVVVAGAGLSGTTSSMACRSTKPNRSSDGRGG
jgi:hypothetical protein